MEAHVSISLMWEELPIVSGYQAFVIFDENIFAKFQRS